MNLRKLNNYNYFSIPAIFIYTVILYSIVYFSSVKLETTPIKQKQDEAVILTKKWFGIIAEEKVKLGLLSEKQNSSMVLIGDEFTEITSTLGALDAKRVSQNPEFAALMVRYINEIDIQPKDTVGVIASGSFPALTVSTLAALQTMDIPTILITSLSASMYGANQPMATWIDMENWLRKKGGLRYQSQLITPGAENDRGDGLLDEGLEMIKVAVLRNKCALYIPKSLKESIARKTDLLQMQPLALLINIGGNQSALGACVHSSSIPNGLNYSMETCSHPDKGIIAHIAENNIPVINLLNIRDIAAQWAMDIDPGRKFTASILVFNKLEINSLIPTIAVLIIISLLLINYRQRNRISEEK